MSAMIPRIKMMYLPDMLYKTDICWLPNVTMQKHSLNVALTPIMAWCERTLQKRESPKDESNHAQWKSHQALNLKWAEIWYLSILFLPAIFQKYWNSILAALLVMLVTNVTSAWAWNRGWNGRWCQHVDFTWHVTIERSTPPKTAEKKRE